MLNVTFAADDNFAPYLSVIIISLLKNNKDYFETINIFILEDNIKKCNKQKIVSNTKKFNVNINFIKTKNIEKIIGTDVTGLYENGEKSLSTYSRLFLPTLLPDYIDKIIYFDCDGLILKPLTNLWNMDISDYYCAGVLDVASKIMKNNIGLSINDDYINAGMLLINLKKWREDNIEKKFLKYLTEKKGSVYYHDQGIINHVLHNKILILNPKYNFLTPFIGTDYYTALKWAGVENNYYSKNIVKNAENDIIFVHLCGGPIDRPWINKNHQYRETYEKYANLTSFKNEIFIDKIEQSIFAKLFVYFIHNKILYLILKIIPKKIVIKLINNHEQNIYKNNYKI